VSAARPWYLGKVGALVALPDPTEPPQVTLTRLGGTHQLLAAGRVRDTLGYKRTWQLGWKLRSAAERSVLSRWYLRPQGPYVLLDPYEPNLLSPNQADAGNALRTTEGWAAITGTLTTPAVNAPYTGDLGLSWALSNGSAANQFLVSGTANTGDVTVADPATDIPVLPSTTYTFSALVAVSTLAASLQVKLGVRWFTAAGVPASTVSSVGTPFTPGTTLAAQSTVITSPADAHLVRVTVQNHTSPAAAVSVLLSQLQFEQAAAASAWELGLGVPRVFVDDLPRAYPRFWRPDVDLTLTLVES